MISTSPSTGFDNTLIPSLGILMLTTQVPALQTTRKLDVIPEKSREEPPVKFTRVFLPSRLLAIFAGVFCSTLLAATAPVFTSGPSVNKQQAYAGETLTFSAAATSSNGNAVTYAWAFGDGTTGGGASVTHVFTVPVTSLSVTVTASDGTLSTSATVSVTIVAPVFGPGLDSDGDGFSDQFEIEAGTDPNDSTSTPYNHAPATFSVTRALQSAKLKVTYTAGKKPKVTVAASGKLLFASALPTPVPAQKVYIVIEAPGVNPGIGYAYDLNSKGTGAESSSGSETFKPVNQPKALKVGLVPKSFNKLKGINFKQKEDDIEDLIVNKGLGWFLALDRLNHPLAIEEGEPTRGVAAPAGQTIPINVYVVYGRNVYLELLSGTLKKDSKGNFTLTTVLAAP